MPHHFLNTFVGILHILYLQAEDSNRKHPAATRDPIFHGAIFDGLCSPVPAVAKGKAGSFSIDPISGYPG